MRFCSLTWQCFNVVDHVIMAVSPEEDAEFGGPVYGREIAGACSGTSFGQSTTPYVCSDLGTRPRHLILLGDQFINWPIPDDEAVVHFVPEPRVLHLPMDIANFVYHVDGYHDVTIAMGPMHRWTKAVTKQWVLDVSHIVAKINKECTIRFGTMLPCADANRMLILNFNCNLAHSINIADERSHRNIFYLPIHKIFLGDGYVPTDGVPDRWQIMAVRSYIISSAK